MHARGLGALPPCRAAGCSCRRMQTMQAALHIAASPPPVLSPRRCAGPALHAAVDQDGGVPRELRLLLPVLLLVQGDRHQGGEADGAGGGVRGAAPLLCFFLPCFLGATRFLLLPPRAGCVVCGGGEAAGASAGLAGRSEEWSTDKQPYVPSAGMLATGVFSCRRSELCGVPRHGTCAGFVGVRLLAAPCAPHSPASGLPQALRTRRRRVRPHQRVARHRPAP